MSYFIGFRHSPSTLVHENRCDIAAVYALILLLGAVLLTPSSQAQTSPQTSASPNAVSARSWPIWRLKGW